jgi:hypothetical protein
MIGDVPGSSSDVAAISRFPGPHGVDRASEEAWPMPPRPTRGRPRDQSGGDGSEIILMANSFDRPCTGCATRAPATDGNLRGAEPF